MPIRDVENVLGVDEGLANPSSRLWRRDVGIEIDEDEAMAKPSSRLWPARRQTPIPRRRYQDIHGDEGISKP
jgi:hypothetical protein